MVGVIRTKKQPIPQVIIAYLKAVNDRDEDAFGALFTKDAVVRDEGTDYRGVPAIKKWLASTLAKYDLTLQPLGLSWRGPAVFLTVKLSGEFPGSPTSTRYRFVLHEGRIVKLNARE